MKKICFFTDNISTIGGIQRCVCMLSNELIKRGINVDILCVNKFNDGKFAFELSNKVNVKYVKKVTLINKCLFFWTRFLKNIDFKYGIFRKFPRFQKFIHVKAKYSRNKNIISQINEGEYDYVIATGGALILILGCYLKKIKSKIIGWQHSSCIAYFGDEDKNKNYKYLSKLYHTIIKEMYKYITLTQVDVKWFEDNMNFECECIYNMKTFDTNSITTLENKKFISVGRLVQEKNFDLLVEAFSIFSKKNDEWILNIYGDGEEKKHLNQKIKDLKLTKRVFINDFEKNIYEKYLDSSIFITTSKIEGFGLVLIEAMECGLPVITTNIPAFEELINKENGYIIDKNTADCLAQYMLKLVEEPEIMKKISLNNKKEAKKYSSETIVNKWLKILT